MWDTDHFVTQVNPEPGPAGPRGISTDGMACAKAHNCRDFVDYDSNVIAVAHGVGGAEKGKKALARIVRRTSPSHFSALPSVVFRPVWVYSATYGYHL